MLFTRLFVPIPVFALLPKKFPRQTELLIDIEISLKVLAGSLFIGKKLLADKIHAPEELSQFFLDVFFVRFQICHTPYYTNNASKSLGVIILMSL